MAAPKYEEEQEECEEWLTTYSDAITLLMAFFVMLVSFSKIDIPTFEQVAAGIKNELGKRDTVSPISQLKIDVQDVVYNMQADQAVNLETSDRGLTIELQGSAFFKSGSAELREEAVPVVEKIFETISAERFRFYNVDVEGHSDDVPIHTERYPSNWELSGGRAATVARFFIDKGMDPVRLKATAFAETRPKVPNRDAEDKPIAANQALNRRIAIEVYPMSLPERRRVMERAAARDAAERAKSAPPATQPGATPPGTPPTGTAPGAVSPPTNAPGGTAPQPAPARPAPAPTQG